MKTSFYITAKKILRFWGAFVALYSVALLTFPNRGMDPALFIVTATQVLLFLTSIAIVRHEVSPKNKFVFVNFGVFFSVSIFSAVGRFVGFNATFFADVERSGHYFDAYAAYGAYGFFLALAIVYLAIDALFRDFKTIQKYAVSAGIVGTFFVVYFSGFLTNPDYAYQTQDVLDWKRMYTAFEDYKEVHGTEPDAAELAAVQDMYVYQNAVPVATLHPEARLARVTQLYPYLHDLNYNILIMKPASYYMIFMGVVAVGFILLFFGYQYMRDPPQGAYIDKVMFLFLLFSSMEVLHNASYIKSLEWQTFAEIVGAGQYASSVVLLLITLFFALRLRFIMSVKGEFYEHELEARPAGITRWRDSLDTMVVESFFNRKIVHGRLFASAVRAKADPGN
jgi:hypothetical protein